MSRVTISTKGQLVIRRRDKDAPLFSLSSREEREKKYAVRNVQTPEPTECRRSDDLAYVTTRWIRMRRWEYA